jgi:hypothetical protein
MFLARSHNKFLFSLFLFLFQAQTIIISDFLLLIYPHLCCLLLHYLHTILHITDSFVSKEVLATARERERERERERRGKQKYKQTDEAKHRAVALSLPLRRIERREENRRRCEAWSQNHGSQPDWRRLRRLEDGIPFSIFEWWPGGRYRGRY